MDSICETYGIQLPKISQDTITKLSFSLTTADFKNAADSLNPNSCPGIDGIHTKIFRHLYDIMPQTLTKVLNKKLEEVIEGKEKSSTLWTGKIILIRQNSKVKTIKRVRPKSLLTTFYKTLSNAINTRLTFAVTVEQLIPESIIAYRHGVDPSEKLREVHDFLDSALSNKTECWGLQADID